MNNLSKNVLVLVAHPDDFEMGCFGAALKYKSIGYNIDVIITTKGGYKSKNSFSKPKRDWKTIKSEFENAQNILGTKYIILNNKVLNLSMTHEIIHEVEEVVRKKKYEILITHHYGDSHQDHQITSKIGMVISRLGFQKVLMMEIAQYSAVKLKPFNPNYYIDITNYMDKKIAAINCYKSYISKKTVDGVVSLNKFRGFSVGREYCEAFETVYVIE